MTTIVFCDNLLARKHDKRERAMAGRRRGLQFTRRVAAIGAVAAVQLAAIASAQAAAGCDGGKWPLSPVQAHFGAALPALASGGAIPALGAPALVNLSAQDDIAFPHAPARASKANPAYAAVLELGTEPAATYQITVSAGAWIDLLEDGDLVKQSGYIRAKDCPGVDKSIRFATRGGALTIQISGAYGKAIKLEAARVE